MALLAAAALAVGLLPRFRDHSPLALATRPLAPPASRALSTTPSPYLRIGDCAFLGPDPDDITSGSTEIRIIAVTRTSCDDGQVAFVLASTTAQPACDDGYITVTVLGSSTIDCLALVSAHVGECFTTADTVGLPYAQPCTGFVPTTRISVIVPHADTGVYGCQNPTAALYIGPQAEDVACLQPVLPPPPAPTTASRHDGYSHPINGALPPRAQRKR